MPKVNRVHSTTEGFGFVVTHDDARPAAHFEFKIKDDAEGAHQKMQEILATCHAVKGFA
jgi:hypothetical protein